MTAHGDFGIELDTGGDFGADPAVPVWAVFGDLMAGLLGAFVLILVCTIGMQMDLSSQLERANRERALEAQQRHALELALAGPLATGRVTFVDGRIGVNGSVLFAFNSAQLQPEGRQLLASLAGPLAAFLEGREQLLMVSGYTDDRQVRGGNREFADNWELSAQRALTVTRALIEAGLPPDSIFAAAFGSGQAAASNADAAGRSRNRRVEMAPVPRAVGAAGAAPRTP